MHNVSGRYVRRLSLEVGAGEIVGIAGLLGSGREEVPYIVAGVETLGVSGEFTVGDQDVDDLSLTRARELGIVMVPADRLREGVVAEFSTAENVCIGALSSLQTGGLLRPSLERSFATRWLAAVHADPDYAPRPIATLSGGNQQKAMLARALCVAPRLLVLSEPTAGVDIGARHVIYDELRSRADEGLAVLMASSDVEDLLACCDRVIVLRDGVIAGEFEGARMTKTAIAQAIEGVHHEHH
jgi:ABC-type sugar transport system ATPase subunit